MFVRTAYRRASNITAGKIYKARNYSTSGQCASASITTDTGGDAYILLGQGCAHLSHNEWEVVPNDDIS